MKIFPQQFGRALPALITAIFLWFAVSAPAAAPATPENLQPAWLFGENMLTWDEVPGATSYNIYRYDSTNGVWLTAATSVTVPRYREVNSEATTYTVTAVNADGEGAPAPAVTCVQTGDGLTMVYNEWNSPKYDTSASIQWMIDLVAGADGMLEVGTTPTNLTFMGWDTNYTQMHRILATNLTPATFYFARLTSVASNRTGVSGWITFSTMQTNQPPIVSDQTFNTWEDPWQPLQIWFSGWDPDYPPQPVTFSILNGPSHGTLIYTNYAYQYVPDTNWFGTDTFQFVGTDGQLTSAPGTITITVQSINDLPVGIDKSVVTGQGMPLEITLQANDVENDPLSFYVSWWPMHGWIESVGTNVIYHPSPNFVGTDVFSFIPIDSSWGYEGHVTITVTNVNDAPVTTNMNVGAHASATYIGELWTADADGDAVTCELVTGTANGTVTVSGTNFIYTPNPGTYFSDSFTYRAFDGQAYSTLGTVWIWVGDTNNVPEAHDQSVTVTRNIASSISLIVSDPDGDPLRVLVINAPTNGTLQFLPFTSLLYRPATNYLGPDSFSYQVWDGIATSGVATVTITVEPPNDPPIAYNASLTTTSSIALSFQLTASDPDGDALTYILTSSPSHGELSGSAPNLVYSPAPGYIGSDSFTFKANDGKVDGNTATITITVLRPNVAPVIASQSLSLAEDTTKAITLTGTDGDGDPLSFRILSGPAHGTVTGTGANRVYRPATNYNGADSFTFTANDGMTDGNTATVNLNITPVNDAPVITSSPNASYTLQEDWIMYFGVMASDPDGDPVTYRIVTPPAHGVLNTNNFQNLTYQGFPRFSGVDSFTWRANDGQVDGPLGTVTITVTGPNDAPTVTNYIATLFEDTTLTFAPLMGDPEGDPLTVIITTQPQHGTLTLSGGNFVYRGFTNYNGNDVFTYRASDGSRTSSVATVSIQIFPMNDAPTASGATFGVNEDTPTVVTLTGADIDGDTLTYTIVSGPLHGTLSGTGASRTYTPAANYYGPDSFTFKVHDGTVYSGVATVTLNVASINDAPSAPDRSIAVNEDTSIPITLTATDAEGNTLTFAVLSGPTNGTLSGTAPNLVYTPNANFNGVDSFTYRAHDGTVAGNTALVTITVNPVNDLPVASGQSVATDEDSALAITLSGSDIDGDTLSYSVAAQPLHGTLSGSGANLTYTPEANFNGNDSFTFRAHDGTAAGNVATVSITVRPLNDAPTANSQSVSTVEDTGMNITLSGSDIDGDSLTFVIVSEPSHGTLSGTGASRTYTPGANYNGPDSFSFKVNDGTIDGTTATVSISVTSANDAPVANAQSLTTAEDTSLNITLSGSDIEGDSLTFVIVSGPSHGTLTGNGANLVYAPAPNYNGPDSFSFKVNDGTVDGSTAMVTINVTAVNDSPVANPQSVTTAEDTAVNIVLAGSDVDGDALTFAIVSGPSHGTLSGTGADRLYTPASNYNGPDSFTFKVNDGSVDGTTATINISVTAVNDAPVANAQSVTTAEDTGLNITLSGSDIDGDSLAFSIVSGPTHGTLTGSGANRVYTPAPNYNGPDSFTFTANDGTVDGTIATININVTTVNDAPTADNQSLSVEYNASVPIILTGSDIDGNPLTFTVVNGPSHGTLSGVAPNLTFTPTLNYSGADSFTFRTSDGDLNSAVATVSITVQPPTAVPAVPSALAATAVSKTQINLSWNDNSSSEDGFKIERSTDNRTFTQIGTVGPNVTTYSSTGLSANKLYYYRVRAYNSLGNSAYSNTASAKTFK